MRLPILILLAALGLFAGVPLCFAQMTLMQAGGQKQVSTAVTFDPVNKGSLGALSNGNLTWTGTGSGAASYAIARSTTSHSSGKFYFEMTQTTYNASLQSGFTNSVGVIASAQSLNDCLTGSTATCSGSQNDDAAYWSPSGYWVGPFTTNTGITWAQGDVIGVAVDFGAQKIWFRQNGGGWDNTTDDPATGTGGFSFSYLASCPCYAAAQTRDSASAITVNFGSTAYSQTPPSGFGNW